MARHAHLHPILKIIEWLSVILLAGILATVVCLVLPIGDSTVLLLVMQGLLSVGMFVVPPLIVARLWSDRPAEWLHLRPVRAFDGKLLLLGICTMICALPLINCLAYWNSKLVLPVDFLQQLIEAIEDDAAAMLENLMRYGDGAWWALLLNILVLAILPALGEELTFRGVLQQFFHNKHVAVWTTAFIFSFIHFQFFGFVPRMLLGALLGYALVWTGNIGYSMVMHATNNAMSVLLFYLSTFVWHLPEKEMDYIGTGDTWWLTPICVGLVSVCLWLMYRRAKITSEETTSDVNVTSCDAPAVG